MGRRSQPETLAAIYQAFLSQRTWKQAELADRIGIKPPALRKWLEELVRAGLPLDREEDHPHVFWSVPAGWFPGGVVLDADEATELLRQLFRLPRSVARDRLVRRVLGARPDGGRQPDRQRAVVAPEATSAEEASLSAVEDSVLQRRALALRYFSATRGMSEARHVSVQRVVPGPPARFVAVCHRDGSLKWKPRVRRRTRPTGPAPHPPTRARWLPWVGRGGGDASRRHRPDPRDPGSGASALRRPPRRLP